MTKHLVQIRTAVHLPVKASPIPPQGLHSGPPRGHDTAIRSKQEASKRYPVVLEKSAAEEEDEEDGVRDAVLPWLLFDTNITLCTRSVIKYV